MKYPAVFRVFASFNIVLFLLLLLQSIVYYISPVADIAGPTVSAAVAIVIIVVSFFWFFGSPKSYVLLTIMIPTLLALAALKIYIGVNLSHSDSTTDTQVAVFFFVYALLCMLYVVFMVVALFFKPVREWKKSVGPVSPLLPWCLFAGVFTLSFAAFYLADRIDVKYIQVDASPVSEYPDSNTAIVDLEHLSEFNGIIIAKDDDSKSFKAVVAYSDSWTAVGEEEYFRHDTLLFKPVGSDAMQKGYYMSTAGGINAVNLLANMPAVKARRVKITTLEGSVMTEHSFGFTMVHSERHFAHKSSAAAYIAADDQRPEPDDYDYVRQGNEYDNVSEEDIITPAMKPLSESEQYSLVDSFIKQLLENYDNEVRSQFNTDHARVVIHNKAFGMYKSFHLLFEYYGSQPLLQLRSERGGGELSEEESGLDNLVMEVTGVPLYRENATLPYQGLNPEFVNWLRAYMLGSAEDRFYDVAARKIYTDMFRRMVWMMAAAHEFVTDQGQDGYNAKANEYRERMSDAEFNGVRYLYETYGKIDVSAAPFRKVYSEYSLDTQDEYFTFVQETAIGFWLRRRLDGSDEEVWKLVQEVLSKYDDYPYGDEGSN